MSVYISMVYRETILILNYFTHTYFEFDFLYFSWWSTIYLLFCIIVGSIFEAKEKGIFWYIEYPILKHFCWKTVTQYAFNKSENLLKHLPHIRIGIVSNFDVNFQFFPRIVLQYVTG